MTGRISLSVLILLFFCAESVAQKVQVNIRVMENDTRMITPVMACITKLGEGIVVVPPDGMKAGPPTFPAPFFHGIPFSGDKDQPGPVRRTDGPGEVNGQRTYVYQSNPSIPYWPDSLMYQVSGDFSITLSPGRYRINLQHGNEYIPVSDVFEVTEKKSRIVKKYILKRWIDLPAMGWYSGDVHAHHALDKPEFRDYLLQFAKAEDVHMVNMLEMGDRQSTHFKAPAFGKDAGVCKNNYCLAYGQEEPRSDYGHIIGLNTGSLARDTTQYNHYDIVFDKIHKAENALVGYAHFAYKGEGVTKGMALYAPTKSIDFVELLQNTQLNQEDYYRYLNLGFRISAAAGSDFPWGSTIGDGRTYVYTGNPFSPDKWFAGLKAGHSFVSNGPLVFLEAGGKIPGMELKTSAGETVPLRVRAVSNEKIGVIHRVEVFNNDGLLAVKNNASEADTVDIELDHIITKSQWVCANVVAGRGAVAHTSPVYIIADGKPVIDKQKAPALIEHQLELLDSIIADENNKTTPDKGVLHRVETARSFYRQLLR